MKTIAVLGSTGSIGTQTLEVVEELGNIRVAAISGNQNIDLLEKQARKFRPELVAVMDGKKAELLKSRLADTNIRVCAGMEGLKAAATLDGVQTVVTSVVGNVGLEPTFAAIAAGKDIALANKETLVSAGQLVMDHVRRYGVSIYPVDSEHSAIFQSLQGNEGNAVRRILLTASGGPFRGKKRKDVCGVRERGISRAIERQPQNERDRDRAQRRRDFHFGADPAYRVHRSRRREQSPHRVRSGRRHRFHRQAGQNALKIRSGVPLTADQSIRFHRPRAEIKTFS